MCKGVKQQKEIVRGSEVKEQIRGGSAGRKECNMRLDRWSELQLDRLWIPTWRESTPTAVDFCLHKGVPGLDLWFSKITSNDKDA